MKQYRLASPWNSKGAINSSVQLMLKFLIFLKSKSIMIPSQVLKILCTIVIAAMETRRDVLCYYF